MYTNHESFRSFIASPDVTRIVMGFLIANILTTFIQKVSIGEQIENKKFNVEKTCKRILLLFLEFYALFLFYKFIMFVRPHENSEIYLKKIKP